MGLPWGDAVVPIGRNAIDSTQSPAASAFPEWDMAKKFPIDPAHPERTCWGCDNYCAADQMICGNGTERTQHPVELFGEGWEKEGIDPLRPEPREEPAAAG
jgi:hypothetical protein